MGLPRGGRAVGIRSGSERRAPAPLVHAGVVGRGWVSCSAFDFKTNKREGLFKFRAVAVIHKRL